MFVYKQLEAILISIGLYNDTLSNQNAAFCQASETPTTCPVSQERRFAQNKIINVIFECFKLYFETFSRQKTSNLACTYNLNQFWGFLLNFYQINCFVKLKTLFVLLNSAYVQFCAVFAHLTSNEAGFVLELPVSEKIS